MQRERTVRDREVREENGDQCHTYLLRHLLLAVLLLLLLLLRLLLLLLLLLLATKALETKRGERGGQ